MIVLHLMGGLGNQMFQYATLRNMMLENNEKGMIELSGIKGLKKNSHNIYSLDKFNIDSNIYIIDKKISFRSVLNYFLYIIYCAIPFKSKNKFKFVLNIQKFLNYIGCYCIPEGYIPLPETRTKKSYMIGYFQSYHYFKKHEKEIRNELKVKLPIREENKMYYEMIKNNNSVCIHVRRGDYVGTNYEVCDLKYYKEAIDLMNKKVDNPLYFIFSDDIEWVKKNLFIENVVYVDKKNPNYEDLRLMYYCKNFIISNSSFSWWAQFLSDNDNKIVIAPSKWDKNDSNRDLYQENWELINV